MPKTSEEADSVAHRIERGECADPGSWRMSFNSYPKRQLYWRAIAPFSEFRVIFSKEWD